MITTQESAETTWQDLESRDKKLQDILKSSKCVNCKRKMKDLQKIDFIVLENGALKWWHHRDYIAGSTC